jgi:hypothetical protein
LWLVAALIVSTGLAVAMCAFTQVHYFAPATVAVYVLIIEGLRYLWEQEGLSERAFAVAVVGTVILVSLTRQTAASAMNAAFQLPDTRALITKHLDDQAGKQLVLVSYDMSRHYPGDELVHNWADFGSQKILWARSKGPGNDSDLCRDYSDRTFWSVTTDDVSFSLKPLDLCGKSGPNH